MERLWQATCCGLMRQEKKNAVEYIKMYIPKHKLQQIKDQKKKYIGTFSCKSATASWVTAAPG